jgi:1,6-anhydro-N-acetylmuramate kinase
MVRSIGLLSNTSMDGVDVALMRELADRLPCPVVLAESFGWSSDAMEAQAFAYLGLSRGAPLKKTADHLSDDNRRGKTVSPEAGFGAAAMWCPLILAQA